MSSKDGHDKIFSIVIGMIILGLFFLYLKRSGQLEEIKDSLRAFSSD